MVIKLCTKCMEEKSVDSFSKRTKNGKEGLQTWCKACRKVYDHLNYKKNPQIRKYNGSRKRNKVEWTRELKINRPCTDCKQIFHPVCMDWDHLPQYKKIKSIARLAGENSSKQIILEEMAKCELVCANCHRLRTYFRRKLNK